MAKKILIINPFGIGDVLFSTPLVSALKENSPSCHIGYICNIKTEAILRTNPEIERIFVFERDGYRGLWKRSKVECIKKFLKFWKEVKKTKFDLLIDLSLGKEYAFLCWQAGIKERRGFNYKGRGRFLTHKVPFEGFNDKPVAEYYLGLVSENAGKKRRLVLIPSDKDRIYIYNFLKTAGVNEKDALVGLAPGGGAAFGKDKAYYKRWPWQKFPELIKRIVGMGARPILLCGPGEEDLAISIRRAINSNILIAPKTTIREMAALMKRCKLIVCNDGGMLHTAVSQDVPTVSMFGPTDEKVYGPYPASTRHIIIKSNIDCRPCYRRFKLPECSVKKCMEDISVDTVFNAVSKFI